RRSRPHSDVLQEPLPADLSGVDVARRVGRQELDAAPGIDLSIRDEGGAPPRASITDTNSTLPARVPSGIRHTVTDVDHVLRVDEDSAGATELCPLVNVLTVRAEDLNPVITSIRD